MNINIKVWQALSLLSKSHDGKPMSEARCRMALSQVGMRRREMDEPYPEASIPELFELMQHPDRLEQQSLEASQWMIHRN